MITSSLYGKFTLDKQDGTYKRAELDIEDVSESNNRKSTDSNISDFVKDFENSISETNMENKLLNLK